MKILITSISMVFALSGLAHALDYENYKITCKVYATSMSNKLQSFRHD